MNAMTAAIKKATAHTMRRRRSSVRCCVSVIESGEDVSSSLSLRRSRSARVIETVQFSEGSMGVSVDGGVGRDDVVDDDDDDGVVRGGVIAGGGELPGDSPTASAAPRWGAPGSGWR